MSQTTSKCKSLILPSETPPTQLDLKRNILFFDEVSLLEPTVDSLIGENEVVEQFGRTMVAWAPRVPFPQTNTYAQEFEELVAQISLPLSRRIITITKAPPPSDLDPAIAWCIYNSAISDQTIVQSAIPDYRPGAPTQFLREGSYHGMEISIGGQPSKYQLAHRQPVRLPSIEEEWSLLAWARIGRAIKSLRICQGMDCQPISLSDSNTGILSGIHAIMNPIRLPSQGMARQSALISLDRTTLNDFLEATSWRDLLKIRKSFLYKAQQLQGLIQKEIMLSQQVGLDQAQFNQAMQKIQSDFDQQRSSLEECWTRLGIGVAATGAAGGLTWLVLPQTWAPAIGGAIIAGLAGTSLRKEIQDLVITRRKVTRHPLFFFDNL